MLTLKHAGIQGELRDLNTTKHSKLTDKSVAVKLDACLKDSTEHFENISRRLVRFGEVWGAVSYYRYTNYYLT